MLSCSTTLSRSLILPVFFLIIIFFFINRCSFDQLPAEQRAYVEKIEIYRKQKDDYFKNSPHSPLPPKVRLTFKKLSYFPVQPHFALRVRFNKLVSSDTVSIPTTDGKLKMALRYGYFQFAIEQQQCKLFAYKFLDGQTVHEKYLFIPFMDLSNDSESYRGGRFLDLQEHENLEYTLDFNQAYNPYCAYGNNNYICPMPPEENSLNIAIPAGEKILPQVINH